MRHFKPLLIETYENFLEAKMKFNNTVPGEKNVAELTCWLQSNKDFDHLTAKYSLLPKSLQWNLLKHSQFLSNNAY